MAIVTQYITYVIFFHNEDEYNYALAIAGGDASSGGLYNFSPNTAAVSFGIPIPYPSGDLDTISKGIYFVSDMTTDGTNPVDVGWRNGAGGKVQHIYLQPNDNAGVIVPGVTMSHGAATGSDTLIKWCGNIVYMKGAEPTTETPTLIPQRRWIGGVELGFPNEGLFLFNNGVGSRDASRTIDGIGFPIRGTALSGAWNRKLNELIPGYTSNRSWERFYFRIRRLPAADFMFWRCHGTPAPAAGSGLRITTTGNFQLVTIDSGGSITVLSTTPTALLLNKWYRCDNILKYDNSGGINHGTIFTFLNGIAMLNSTGFNMDANNLHTESDLGNAVATDSQVEMDFDDWINADWPVNGGVLTLDSMDWLMGSHVRRVWVTSGVVTGYTPAAYPIMNQGVSPDAQLNSALASTTSGALLSGITDVPPLGVQDHINGLIVGPVAAIVSVRGTNSLSTDGQLGYSIAGGAPVMTTIDETAGLKTLAVIYRPSQVEPTEISPFLIRYTKSLDAANAIIRSLAAIVEYIGVWGQEDVDDPDLYPEDAPHINWLHNCRYPNTPYAAIGPPPQAMVFAFGGTYTGNGTFQDITLPDACHLLFIRGVGTGSNGVKWFGASLGGHNGVTEQVVPNFPVRVFFDDITETFKFRVTGSSSEINGVASTYQYVAFCDPGMRFCVAGAYSTPAAVSSRTNTLQNPAFLPEFAFVQRDLIGGLGSAATGLWSRGPGNLASTANPMDNSGPVSTFATFGIGAINTETNAHGNIASQFNYLAFRSVEPNCGWVAIQCMSYTGNGTSPRVITLTPTSGRYPFFALVIPTTTAQASIFRDPSHVANNSALFYNNSNTTTGIVAGGIDSITVSTLLNVNEIVYNVFVIPGDNLGWNNGLFYPPNCDAPEPWYNPVMVPANLGAMGEGGLTLDGSTTITMLKNISGIYTLVPGKTNDTLYDRQSGQASVDVKIPNPTAKTGYLGG